MMSVQAQRGWLKLNTYSRADAHFRECRFEVCAPHVCSGSVICVCTVSKRGLLGEIPPDNFSVWHTCGFWWYLGANEYVFLACAVARGHIKTEPAKTFEVAQQKWATRNLQGPTLVPNTEPLLSPFSAVRWEECLGECVCLFCKAWHYIRVNSPRMNLQTVKGQWRISGVAHWKDE